MSLSLQITFLVWFPSDFGLEKQPFKGATRNQRELVSKGLWVHLQRWPDLSTFPHLTTSDSFRCRIVLRSFSYQGSKSSSCSSHGWLLLHWEEFSLCLTQIFLSVSANYSTCSWWQTRRRCQSFSLHEACFHVPLSTSPVSADCPACHLFLRWAMSDFATSSKRNNSQVELGWEIITPAEIRSHENTLTHLTEPLSQPEKMLTELIFSVAGHR